MESFYEAHQTDVPLFDTRLETVARMVSRRQPARILDLACGRGVLLTHLMKALPSADLVGVDISPSAVKHVADLGIQGVAADISDGLPFDDERFDCVIFGEVIEHIVDPDKALQEVSRVLIRGGQLIVTTPNLASWFNRLLLLAGVQPIFTETSLHVNLGRRTSFLGQWRPTQGHLKIFTRDALREMLDGNGFQVERVLGAPFAAPTPARKLDALLARVPSLASNFVAEARNLRTLQTSYKSLPGWH